MNDRDRLRLFALLSALEEGVLSESGRAELVALLKSSDEAQELYLSYQSLSSSLSLYACEHVIAQDDGPVALAELAEMEARAEAQLVDLDALKRMRAQERKAAKVDRKEDTLTAREIVGVLEYVGRHALKSKAMRFAGAAAVLLLAVTLFFIFSGDNDTPDAPEITDNTPNKPAESAPPILRDIPVATLTNTHNAQWGATPAERALARGSELQPGQRLTLTAGFAEITTNRGAVAILEAPASVELLDNNNALQLHSGKLVGICETESSKGFVVRTSHMDVTDLGTRFGVNASQRDRTDVHVFEGVVQATRESAGTAAPNRETLRAGSALRAQAGGVGFQSIAKDAARFAGIAFAGGAFAKNAAEAGIHQLTGQVQWIDRRRVGKTIQDMPTSDDASVFEEIRRYTLDADLPVAISQPGRYGKFDRLTATATIPKGTVLRSYVVILHPGPRAERAIVEASMRFEGEVLGIAATEQDWRVFVGAVPGGLFADDLEKNILAEGGADGDFVELAPDRRSLKVRFSVSGGKADAVRVIVRETADAPNLLLTDP